MPWGELIRNALNNSFSLRCVLSRNVDVLFIRVWCRVYAMRWPTLYPETNHVMTGHSQNSKIHVLNNIATRQKKSMQLDSKCDNKNYKINSDSDGFKSQTITCRCWAYVAPNSVSGLHFCFKWYYWSNVFDHVLVWYSCGVNVSL